VRFRHESVARTRISAGTALSRPGGYGCGVDRRPVLASAHPAATPEEAAAIVAAIEQFTRDTAPPPGAPAPPGDPWLRAARLEAVGADPDAPPW
jgi:hypothetical protein